MSTSRNIMFNFRMSAKEAKWLELISKHTGLSKSDVMRQLLRKKYKEIQSNDTR